MAFQFNIGDTVSFPNFGFASELLGQGEGTVVDQVDIGGSNYYNLQVPIGDSGSFIPNLVQIPESQLTLV